MDRLVLLGCKGGPAIRPGGQMPTSSLLQLGGRSIVVDCGLGVTRGLTEAGVDLKSIGLIVITHLHSDHVLELGPLLHTAWTAGLKKSGSSTRVGLISAISYRSMNMPMALLSGRTACALRRCGSIIRR